MIATIESTIRKVLSQANEDQNQHYPPRIAIEHFKIVSNCILDESAAIYPTDRSVVEKIKPFLETEDIKVVNGMVKLPKECRHVLGLTIFINEKGKACEKDLSPDESRLSKRSLSRDVEIREQVDFNRLSTHKYKKVSLEKPIAAIFHGEGIRISPYDVPMVELRYIRQPKDYFLSVTVNPDDSYFFNANGAGHVESEWEDTAADALFKGMNILYSNYARDTEGANAAQQLLQLGLL